MFLFLLHLLCQFCHGQIIVKTRYFCQGRDNWGGCRGGLTDYKGEQIAHGICAFPTPGSVQEQAGWGPDLVEVEQQTQQPGPVGVTLSMAEGQKPDDVWSPNPNHSTILWQCCLLHRLSELSWACLWSAWGALTLPTTSLNIYSSIAKDDCLMPMSLEKVWI